MHTKFHDIGQNNPRAFNFWPLQEDKIKNKNPALHFANVHQQRLHFDELYISNESSIYHSNVFQTETFR